MQWTHVVSDPSNVNPGGQASVDLLQNARSVAADSIARGNIIKRIVGTYMIRPGAASSGTEGVVAIILTEADAEAASAVADPLTDTLAPWRYWNRFMTGTGASSATPTGEWRYFALDLKMNLRIKNRADALNIIFENDDGTQSFSFALGLRVLMQK